MKTSILRFSFVAAICCGLLSSTRAQVQTQYETISVWDGSTTTFTGGRNYVQTFNTVLEVTSMTYTFAGTTGLAATNLSVKFVEWNPNNTIGTVLEDFGTISIPAYATWTANTFDTNNNPHLTFDYTLTLGAAGLSLDSVKTYAMVLSSASSSSLALASIADSTFAYGDGLRQNANTSYSNIGDWGFSQIVVTPYVAPTPESSTIAAILGVALVAGLVGFRIRQQRQLALVPVTSSQSLA